MHVLFDWVILCLFSSFTLDLLFFYYKKVWLSFFCVLYISTLTSLFDSFEKRWIMQKMRRWGVNCIFDLTVYPYIKSNAVCVLRFFIIYFFYFIFLDFKFQALGGTIMRHFVCEQKGIGLFLSMYRNFNWIWMWSFIKWWIDSRICI